MFSVFFALILGVLIGYSEILPKSLSNFAGKALFLGLFLLLFTMGLAIGSNQEILKSLNTLGFKAFSLALASIIGSIIAVLAVKNYVLKDEK